MCLAVYELLTACIEVGIARAGDSETCAFDTISIYIVQKHTLLHVTPQALFGHGNKAAMLLFCNNNMQPQNGNAFACSKPTALETCNCSV